LFLLASFPTLLCHEGSAGTHRTSINHDRQTPEEDGIHVPLNKTKHSAGKRLIIEWDQEGEMRAKVASDSDSLMKPRNVLGMPPEG